MLEQETDTIAVTWASRALMERRVGIGELGVNTTMGKEEWRNELRAGARSARRSTRTSPAWR